MNEKSIGHVVVNTSPGAIDPITDVLSAAGATFDVFLTPDEEFTEACKTADAIIVLPTNTLITADLIGTLERCRVIVRLGVGVDNIDVGAASRHGIPVANVPDYCEEEVACHAVSLLLACLRQVVAYDRTVQDRAKSYGSTNPLPRLSAITVGVLGFGRIGRSFADRIVPFGSKIIVYDPYISDAKIREFGAEPASLEDVFRQSDAISVHLPLTEQTKGLIDERLFQLMKPTAYIINTARGLIIKESDLVDALRKGIIGGAALDVVEVEPIADDHPLLGMQNVILTPHIAWYSEASRIDLLTKGAEEAVRVLRGELPRPEAFVNATDLANKFNRGSKDE